MSTVSLCNTVKHILCETFNSKLIIAFCYILHKFASYIYQVFQLKQLSYWKQKTIDELYSPKAPNVICESAPDAFYYTYKQHGGSAIGAE